MRHSFLNLVIAMLIDRINQIRNIPMSKYEVLFPTLFQEIDDAIITEVTHNPSLIQIDVEARRRHQSITLNGKTVCFLSEDENYDYNYIIYNIRQHLLKNGLDVGCVDANSLTVFLLG